MAGLNTRFHDAGFDIPKYLLPWENQTIIYEIIKQLGKFEEIILLANKRDLYFKNKLVDTIAPFGLTEDNIHYIGDTNGQAHTAYIGASLLKNQNKPFFIHNSDTVLIGRNFNKIKEFMIDGYIDVFVANNPNYSYVRSKDGVVTEIVEKYPISPFASSGLYGFKTPQLYKESYEKLLTSFIGKEMYLSNLFAYMIENNYSIGINDLDNKYETIVLGSPQEYGLELAKKSLK